MTTLSAPIVDRGVVVGVFHDRADAGRAIAELRHLGFSDDRVGLIARNGVALDEGNGTQWEVGAASGAIAGGLTGTALGFAVAAGLMPGIGPIVAGGLFAGIAASAVAGAAAGGVLGALIGLGIPEEEAAFYHGEFEAGRTIVTVRAGDKADIARSVLIRCGGAEPYAPSAVKAAEVEMSDAGADLPRADAARRMNEGVEQLSSPHMPPGI